MYIRIISIPVISDEFPESEYYIIHLYVYVKKYNNDK